MGNEFVLVLKKSHVKVIFFETKSQTNNFYVGKENIPIPHRGFVLPPAISLDIEICEWNRSIKSFLTDFWLYNKSLVWAVKCAHFLSLLEWMNKSDCIKRNYAI